MAATYVDKLIKFGADNDNIQTPLQIKGIHVRRSAASSGVVQVNDGSDSVVYFSVNCPGTGTTGGVNGYYMGFGRGGIWFPSGIRLASTNAEMTVFLA